MKKQVIAYLHTHWDREWYREFEVFRLRLLRVFDNVLELLVKNKIPCFYFDGQVSALEDYLEMRPEKCDIIKALIKHKKLFIGPFYCLVDEFLTDKTCFEKNLELGMKAAIDWGCTDFIGYLADTFGHSKNVPDILREFGVDKCIVWRGCADFPADFSWCGMDTVNLIRGYFHDVFSLDIPVEQKAEILKKELDLISEKSDKYILFPIGADHLGIETDIAEQIEKINELLKEDYYIKLSSPFEYFNKVQDNFKKFTWDDELRDNSKTFTLQGCYSSRLDLKRYNTECSYMLDLASRFAQQQKENKYDSVLEYAYKMLVKNQAHDSICGCSTDDVHAENIIRYKKILQIANTIIDELKFNNNFEEKKIINLSDKLFSGMIEFKSSKALEGYDKIDVKKGFDTNLLTDTRRIPVTEDYNPIYTYLAEVSEIEPDEIEYIMPNVSPSDLKVDNNLLENNNIKLQIIENKLYINKIPVSIMDFIDLGDSYNNGPKAGDCGKEYNVYKSRVITDTPNRAVLRIDFDGDWDIISAVATLDKNSKYIKFDFDWTNTQKNHLVEIKFELENPIREVFSEDMNVLIKRTFDPEYNIRENLPQEKGMEAKTNTAPMQRGLVIDEDGNNVGLVTKGLTQYEVYKNQLLIPILRSTGQISNPLNPARTTPAGPPIEVEGLQMIGRNRAEFCVFFGNHNAFDEVLNQEYNYVIT